MMNFGKVLVGENHEFKERFRRVCEELKGSFRETKLFGVERVRKFGGDVVLGDEGIEGRARELGAVGLDFDCGEGFRKILKEGDYLFLLQEGLAPGDDEAVSGRSSLLQNGRDFFAGEGQEMLFFGILALILMRPRASLPVPCEGGVAPDAVEVTERESQENCRTAYGGAFSLQGPEDFWRAVWQAGKFHGQIGTQLAC